MLRKTSNPATDSTSAAAGNDERFVDHDNDKNSKIKRQKDSQTKSVLFCLGIIALLVVIVRVRSNHSHKYTPERLRKTHSSHHRLAEEEEDTSLTLSRQDNEEQPADVGLMTANDFLPPYSIYSPNLEVEDIHGGMVNFSKFRGMVTLVVNVACL
jgi:hypothetical protein